jgi:hypothetical protein
MPDEIIEVLAPTLTVHDPVDMYIPSKKTLPNENNNITTIRILPSLTRFILQDIR